MTLTIYLLVAAAMYVILTIHQIHTSTVRMGPVPSPFMCIVLLVLCLTWPATMLTYTIKELYEIVRWAHSDVKQ